MVFFPGVVFVGLWYRVILGLKNKQRNVAFLFKFWERLCGELVLILLKYLEFTSEALCLGLGFTF